MATMAEIISANDGNFDSFMNSVKTIIVDFWAPTCAPCKLMEPGLEKIAATYPENVKVLKVNVNENPLTSSRFFVRSLPTLLFIKNGLVKTQIIGAVNPGQIEKTLIEVQ
jgi:thioredoxin 1